MKKTFMSIYNATAEAVKGAKQGLVLKRNKRAVESAIDSAEDAKISAEEELDSLLSVVANGQVIDVNKILMARQKYANAEATIKELESFRDEFFDEAEAP